MCNEGTSFLNTHIEYIPFVTSLQELSSLIYSLSFVCIPGVNLSFIDDCILLESSSFYYILHTYILS